MDSTVILNSAILQVVTIVISIATGAINVARKTYFLTGNYGLGGLILAFF